MRAILALAVVVLLMGLAGWLTFGSSPDKATINIETEEIKRDTEDAVDAAEDLIESGARAITNNADENDTDTIPPTEQDHSTSLPSESSTPAP